MKKTLAPFFVALICILCAAPAAMAGEGEDHVCFRRVDADHDSIVTFEEFKEHYNQDSLGKFNGADANKDGTLDHDEYHDMLGGGAGDH